jgi:hypothetical protein
MRPESATPQLQATTEGRGGAVTEDTQRARPRSWRDAWQDDRGVMVVAGTLMSFFMIGTVWYVLGIGNVINYREQLQNATDASAFAGAVYDARGMNLLATINIFMGFILSLVVMAKIMQVVFWLGWAANCGECADSWGFDVVACFECSTYDPYEALTWLGDDVPGFVKTVEQGSRAALEAMHYTEEGVAIIWPWVSASKSQVAGTYYANGVAVTTSFAYSQIPVGLDKLGSPGSIESIVQSFQQGSFSPITNNIPTERLGLPVNSAKYTDLCKMALLDITSADNAFQFIPGGFMNLIAGVLAEVLYTMDEFFCDAASGSGLFGSILGAVESVGNFLGFGLNPDGTIKDSDYTYSPMQLYPSAKMGDGYFGVWGTGLGVWTNALDIAKPGLKVSAMQSKKGTVIGDAPKDATLAVTRAEFYYDPKSGENSTGAKKNETSVNLMDYPSHNVLWNPRWRARLVRYHGFPTVGVIGAFQSLFSGNLSAAATFAGESAAGYANSQLMKTAIGNSLGQIEGDLPTTVQNILDNGGAASNSVTDMNVKPATGIYH